MSWGELRNRCEHDQRTASLFALPTSSFMRIVLLSLGTRMSSQESILLRIDSRMVLFMLRYGSNEISSSSRRVFVIVFEFPSLCLDGLLQLGQWLPCG